MLVVVIIIAVVVVFFVIKKKKTSTPMIPVEQMELTNDMMFNNSVLVPQELDQNVDKAARFKEIIKSDSTGALQTATGDLMKVFFPNKHGEFNDAKACAKHIANAEEVAAKMLGKGTTDYVIFFATIYDQIMARMLSSDNKKIVEFASYTLTQANEYYSTGKCQTFVKGLHPDGLAARAEILMAVTEKCWFDEKKTTMFRKDMEKRTLPTATQS